MHGDRLALRQVLSSGGSFPVSVAVHGDLVYVLNALGGGRLAGYRVLGGGLVPIPGSGRTLGLNPAASPQYTNTPGQVAFTPHGSRLIVTTKANGNDIDVFGVWFDGGLSAAPMVNSEPGTVPFAISFDLYGHLLIAEAGTNALATFALAPSGTVSLVDAVPTGASATCWVAWWSAIRGRCGGSRPRSCRARRSLRRSSRTPGWPCCAAWPAARTARSTWPRCARPSGLPAALEPEDLTPRQRDEFVELYRRWRAEPE